MSSRAASLSAGSPLVVAQIIVPLIAGNDAVGDLRNPVVDSSANVECGQQEEIIVFIVMSKVSQRDSARSRRNGVALVWMRWFDVGLSHELSGFRHPSMRHSRTNRLVYQEAREQRCCNNFVQLQHFVVVLGWQREQAGWFGK